jgi:hypothetical protein
MGSNLLWLAAGKSCGGNVRHAPVLQEKEGFWAEVSHKDTWAEAFLWLASAKQPFCICNTLRVTVCISYLALWEG